ncbi:hypothetical protein [Rhizobium sullae]|uniref:Uncharacterized protein n=1 Tax=Rhizobium sullae TaxID=50338 RepID=A0A4R3QPG3_RHISU|nr:hypothetical protein [Rhizobium sullae]TCU20276.1 hypothetical protein EV132_101340 [Rhizobium sullae]UWU17770.1 hypothetical protein N2599_20775 [Rhizobium sullae]
MDVDRNNKPAQAQSNWPIISLALAGLALPILDTVAAIVELLYLL